MQMEYNILTSLNLLEEHVYFKHIIWAEPVKSYPNREIQTVLAFFLCQGALSNILLANSMSNFVNVHPCSHFFIYLLHYFLFGDMTVLIVILWPLSSVCPRTSSLLSLTILTTSHFYLCGALPSPA